MSGQKISEHGFFGGSGSPKFPMGVKTKTVSSEEGAGAVASYQDTDAAIKSDQAKGISKAKGHSMKEGYRY